MVERELKGFEFELYREPEITELEYEKIGFVKLPVVTIGGKRYIYDRYRKMLIEKYSKKEHKLTDSQIRDIDWFIDTLKKVKEESKKIKDISSEIRKRSERLEAVQSEQLRKARRRLEDVI